MFDDKRPGARLIGGALVGVMIFGTALGADAATKKKPKRVVKHTRTVTLKYTGGCTAETPAVTGSPTGACSTLGAAGYTIDARPGEKYVSIKVADATGRNVPGQFWQSGNSTVPNDTEIGFCGALKNYRFPVGQQLQLDLDALGGVQSCPGIATQGTITLVFSNLP